MKTKRPTTRACPSRRCRALSQSWAPRYDLRISQPQWERIHRMGAYERRKFRTHVRLQIGKIIDDWEKLNGFANTAKPC